MPNAQNTIGIKSRLVLLAACAAVVVSGCGGQTQSTATPMSQTATPAALTTPTPLRKTPTSKPTLLPPTAQATSTPIPVVTWSSTSPDGKWLTQGMMEGPFLAGDAEQYHAQLKVMSADGAVTWVAWDETSPFGLGYTRPQPFQWSRDGRYLYFTNVPVPDGCSMMVNGTDLWQVDLTNGRVVEFVPSVGLWLSLSPDEKTLAYIGYGGRGLVIRDLATGSERQSALSEDYTQADFWWAGNIVWSPDGTALIFAVGTGGCGPGPQTLALLRMEVSTLAQTTLLRDDTRQYFIARWPETGRVLLKAPDGRDWWMDARTGDLTPAIGVPTSTP